MAQLVTAKVSHLEHVGFACLASHDQNIFTLSAARSYLLLFNILRCLGALPGCLRQPLM